MIAYDDSGGGTAGRLVWMLRVIGHPAALLDGGLRAWPEPLSSGDGAVRRPTTVPPRPWPADRFAGHERIATAAADPKAVVLDARSAPRFSGEDERRQTAELGEHRVECAGVGPVGLLRGGSRSP